ncbi:S46 family peptidase [candidate division KSB1 bacterium]
MKKFIILFSIIILVSVSLEILTADEGMFTPDKIKYLQLEKKGLKIPVEKIFDPPNPGLYEAVIRLGATSEFVSSDGLILTNHHVAFGSVARISTVEKDYITDGFLAKTKDEEVQAQRYTGRIMRLYEDVTKDVLNGVKDNMTEENRTEKINENREKILEKARKKHKDIEEINISSYYDGNKYYMIGYFVIRDIRIVYVPPKSIGNFGGDVDNWEWPRHTGDFSFLRAYVSPDGKGVGYSPDNVPYKPRTWFEIETGGRNEGDFVFIMGFPGRTYRYKSSYYYEDRLTSYYPYYSDYRGARITFLENEMKQSKELELRFIQTTKGMNNGYKKACGILEWYKRHGIIENKRQKEKEFTEFINKDKKLREKFGNVLTEMKDLYTEKQKYNALNNALSSFGYSDIMNAASSICTYSIEKTKPDKDRNRRYREQNIDRLQSQIKRSMSTAYLPLLKYDFKAGLLWMAKLPENLRVPEIEELLLRASGITREEKIDNIVKEAFDNSRLLNPENIDNFFEFSTEDLLNSDDIFIKVAAGLYNASEKISEFNRDFRERENILSRTYTAGMMKFDESKGKVLYPDANSTFRFNYGHIKGLEPRDAVYYKPFTTLNGIVEKYTGEDPFDVPQQLLELAKNRDYGRWATPELGDVAVCFLDNLDTTGGNSGSPVLNAYGKLTGLHFDSNYEGLTGDFTYIPEYKRSIEVDIRYVLFIAEKMGAGFLLDEMGIK